MSPYIYRDFFYLKRNNMKNEERLKIREACINYLEDLDKDQMTGPNCFDADSLTLGIMLKIHPSFTLQVEDELKKKIMEDELYKYFRKEVLKIAEEKKWYGIIALDNNKLGNKFLPGDYEGNFKNPNIRQTGGLSLDDYQRTADEFLRMWKDFIENTKKKGR